MFIQVISLVSLFLFILCPYPGRTAAQSLAQDIHIAFSRDLTTLSANSVITIPADTPLALSLQGLENISITLKRDGKTTDLKTDRKQTLTLQKQPISQTLLLAWNITNSAVSSNGNSINPHGIALTGPWHPVAAQDMFYSLEAELPPDFRGITEADRIYVKQTKHGRKLKAKYPHLLHSITFVAGPYVIHSRKTGKISLYTYFFKEDQQLANSYLDKAVRYIRDYQQLLGPFPFQRYSIVENRLPTGFGMPTFTLLGQAVIRLPFIKETSLAHEILHSWFGNSLRLDGTGNWCEGLTTYLADQRLAEDANRGKAYRKNQLIRYQSYVHSDNTTSLIDFYHGGDAPAGDRRIKAIGYDKASMLFHMLRNEMGDALFFQALQELISQHAYQRIGWADIERQCSSTLQRDLTTFFSKWLLRHDVPELELSKVTFTEQEHASSVKFHLQQKNKTPYTLKVPVVIHTLNGEVKKKLRLTTVDQEFSVNVDSVPTSLVVDPEYDIMRHLAEAEYPAVWMRYLGAEKKFLVLPEEPGEKHSFLPLITDLKRIGAKEIPSQQIKNSDLTKGSFLFLGPSHHSQGLVGVPPQSGGGFTLDVRKNPLNPNHVIVLTATYSQEETAKTVRKLLHYGNVSFLQFTDGDMKRQQTTAADNGIQQTLIPLPSGLPVAKIDPFSAIIDNILPQRVIYIGETHTNYGDHVLQLQIIQALYAKNHNLMIGMEMFPSCVQQVLDDYVNGRIKNEREFLQKSNYFTVWGYDYRLYRGIINFAREHNVPIIGLNLDKNIVSTVYKAGNTDTLSQDQRSQLVTERDLTLPGYRKRLQSIHSMHGSMAPNNESSLAGFLMAQSIWDETMANSIVNALGLHPKRQMVVIAGTGHVYKDSAIPPRVSRRKPVPQAVLITANGMDTGLETGKKADYLMAAETIDLPPAGKIGIVLSELQETETGKDGLQVVQISPHGKAGQAGIEVNDIITDIDGYQVTSLGDLKIGLLGKSPGEVVRLDLLRKKLKLSVEVELSGMTMSSMMMPPGHPKK